MTAGAGALRAIIVDDERLARRELARMLVPHPEVAVVGEADSVDAAVGLIAGADPDVVFLDIQMPRRSGFELLEACEVRGRIVFVTAHDVHAIRAFEVNALDYLMKPVHPERLAIAVARLVAAAAPPAPPVARLEADDHLFLTEARGARFVRVRSIACIRGADDYAEVVVADGPRVLSARPLREWEARLPERLFARVHRTAIVNLEQVDRIERAGDDSYRIWLRGLAEPVPLSRRHAARLKALTG